MILKINKDKLLLIISMFVFGTLSIFVKNINLPSSDIALYRCIFAFIIIFIYLAISKKLLKFKQIKKQISLLAISGIAMGFNWIFLFEAYKYTSVSVATLAYYFAPTIVTIVCSFIFKEKMSIKNIICFIFATIGTILVSGIIGGNIEKTNIFGFLLGMCAALLYATVIILNKKITIIDGINRTYYQFLFAIIILIPYVLLSSGFNLINLDYISWINLLIIGIIHTGMTYCLYFISIKNLRGHEVAILSYVDPMIAIIISVFVLLEPMNIYQIIGTFLILIFSIINEINVKKVN